MKVLTVFGTRPEAIKLAPVIALLSRAETLCQTVVCVTGQHRSMLQQILSVFSIKPYYDLRVMRRMQTLPELTASISEKFHGILTQEKPDLVLVQGDTTSAMVAGLISFYEKIPVGHVEAGLRTENRYSPFPEEMNRRLVGALATLHFAPTESAKAALLRENVPAESIFVTGNTVVDAIQQMLSKPMRKKGVVNLDLSQQRLILVTAHRRENLGEPLENICKAIIELARRHPDTEFLYPVHLNPAVRATVYPALGSEPRVHLVKPLAYPEFVRWMSRAYLILTDSGGIQEEAPVLGKPVLVLRDKTERPEAVQAGSAKVVGTDWKEIVENTELLLNDGALYQTMSQKRNIFGDGKAAERIVDIVFSKFGVRPLAS